MERVYYFVELCIGCEVNVHKSHSEAESSHELALEGNCSDIIDL